jgi:hypothetical protein
MGERNWKRDIDAITEWYEMEPAPREALYRLLIELERLQRVVAEFHQVCPDKHPYAFYTDEAPCSECEVERLRERNDMTLLKRQKIQDE